jgi:hypothetical protein
MNPTSRDDKQIFTQEKEILTLNRGPKIRENMGEIM